MMSSAQLASCLQLPVSLDPLLGISPQQAAIGQLWLQDNTPPTAVPLPQHPVEGGMWGLQQQAGLFSASDLLDLSTVPVLQDNSLVPLPMPQAVSTGLNNMTMFQQQLPDAHLQQVYLTASGEQVMGGNQLTLQQQQLAGCADSSAAAGGSDSILHQQLQQLQEAVQRLTSETVMLKSQVSQAQGQPVSFTTETALTTSSSRCASDMELPCVTAPLAASLISSSSPASSFCGLDSMSNSSWQCTETISGSTNSSPSFALQHKSRLGSGSLASSTPVTASPAQGSSMLRIVSGPQPPQPNLGMLTVPQMLQGARGGPNMGMTGGLANGLAGLAPGSGLVMLNNNNWPEVSGLAHGLLAASAGTSQPQLFAAGPAGLQQGSLLHGCYTMADQQPLHSLQVGRFNTGGSFAQPQARRFNGNSCAYAPKNRPVGSAGARGSSAQAATKPAQGAEAGAPGKAAGATPSVKGPSSGPWAQVSLEDGLRQLWSGEQLLRSQGGRLFNVQQLAWHPVGEPDPSSQDMYNFQKLKRMVQKLDAVHKTRVKLIKRIHAVADHGDKDLKSVYREVRGLIGEMLHDSAMQIKSMDECRVTGLVRLALMLQEALELGPKDSAATAPVLGHVQEAQKVQDESCAEAGVAVGAGSVESASGAGPP